MAKYGGGRQREFILVPKGRDDKGWKSFASEWHSIVQFLQLLYSGGSIEVCNGESSTHKHGQKSIGVYVETSNGDGWNRLFAKVRVRSRKIPVLSLSTKGLYKNFDVFTSKQHIVIGLSTSGDDENPQSYVGGIKTWNFG